MKNKPKECPFCGEIPEIVSAKVGPWAGFSRSLHRCKLIGYIEICDWTEGDEGKLNFTKWNTRVPIAQQAKPEKCLICGLNKINGVCKTVLCSNKQG